MDKVSKNVKLEIINQKLQVFNNSLYDASLDERIARLTNNQEADKGIQKRMKDLIMAIDELEKVKGELDPPQSPLQGGSEECEEE